MSRTGGWHFGAGAVAFGTTECLWLLGYYLAEFPNAWVLKPTSGIVFSALVLLLVSSVMTATRKDDLSWPQCFVLAATGAYAAVITSLLLLGPGNLWPLVLTIDAVIVIVAAFAGALLGDLVRDIRGRAA
jgi:hypothetical protein